MNADTLRKILRDAEEAKDIHVLRRVVSELVLALIQINGETERRAHTQAALLTFESSRSNRRR